jgi:hypothetical protein
MSWGNERMEFMGCFNRRLNEKFLANGLSPQEQWHHPSSNQRIFIFEIRKDYTKGSALNTLDLIAQALRQAIVPYLARKF